MAAAALVEAGVLLIASAGNSATDACERSPGGVPSVITVGASTQNDTVPEWSNFGPCLNMHAPGDLIYGAWKKNDTHYKTVSGTSFAAPFVAGVAAMHLEKIPSLSPEGVWYSILMQGTLYNVLKGVNSRSPNRLINAAELLSRHVRVH